MGLWDKIFGGGEPDIEALRTKPVEQLSSADFIVGSGVGPALERGFARFVDFAGPTIDAAAQTFITNISATRRSKKSATSSGKSFW